MVISGLEAEETAYPIASAAPHRVRSPLIPPIMNCRSCSSRNVRFQIMILHFPDHDRGPCTLRGRNGGSPARVECLNATRRVGDLVLRCGCDRFGTDRTAKPNLPGFGRACGEELSLRRGACREA